jgi:hypothetical protein
MKATSKAVCVPHHQGHPRECQLMHHQGHPRECQLMHHQRDPRRHPVCHPRYDQQRTLLGDASGGAMSERVYARTSTGRVHRRATTTYAVVWRTSARVGSTQRLVPVPPQRHQPRCRPAPRPCPVSTHSEGSVPRSSCWRCMRCTISLSRRSARSDQIHSTYAIQGGMG